MSFLIKRPQELAEIRRNGSVLYFKGGGGGQRDATAEERQLWAMQAASIADQMDANKENRDVTMPVFRQSLSDLTALSNKDFRGEAAADWSQGLGAALGATSRNMERFGSTMNPNALAAQQNEVALRGAAGKAHAMNTADNMKWDRKSQLFNGVQGMPMSTANAMGNAANSIGGLASNIGAAGQRAQSQSNAALQGLGNAAMLMLKDGGEVRLANGGPAAGGSARAAGLRNMTFSDVSGPGLGTIDYVSAIAGPMTMKYAADKFVKPGLDKAGDAIAKGAKSAWNSLTSSATSSAANLGAEEAYKAGLESALQNTGEAIAAKTSEDVAAKAAEEGLSAAGSSIAPYVGAGLQAAKGNYGRAAIQGAGDAIIPGMGSTAGLIMDGLGLEFANGGDVKRKDLTAGGKVKGPGTETSDSIPARLSDGEYVLNAEAVKMVGKEKLDQINNAGLVKREGLSALLHDGRAPVKNGEAHASLGGLLSNIGVAMSGDAPRLYLHKKQMEDAKAEREDERTYRRSRDTVSDARYEDEKTYRQSRDKVGDARYEDEKGYRRERDGVLDGRWAREFLYRVERDGVSDDQWQKQFNLTKSQVDQLKQIRAAELNKVAPTTVGFIKDGKQMQVSIGVKPDGTYVDLKSRKPLDPNSEVGKAVYDPRQVKPTLSDALMKPFTEQMVEIGNKTNFGRNTLGDAIFGDMFGFSPTNATRFKREANNLRSVYGLPSMDSELAASAAASVGSPNDLAPQRVAKAPVVEGEAEVAPTLGQLLLQPQPVAGVKPNPYKPFGFQ